MSADVVATFSRLLSSNAHQQKEKVQEAIDKLSRDTIVKSIPDVVHANGAPNILRMILEGLSNSTQNRNDLLLRVMQSAVTEMCDSEAVPENTSMDIVHIISLKTHELNGNDLAKLVQHSLSFITSRKNLQGKWLSLFPMLLSELGKHNRVTVDGESMTGQEYCTEVMNSLCNTVVETEDAVAFAALLRELKIPPNTANRFIEKLCSLIPEMEPQEIPPLVYQVLFLCDQSDHLLPLLRLGSYFNDKLKRVEQINSEDTRRGNSMDIDSDLIESANLKEILQAKATCVYHISRAASTGHPLGKEFLKYVRNRVSIPELILVPFILEVGLSLGGLPQFRDVIELLRNTIQRCLQSNEKQRHSAWMRDICFGKTIDVKDLLGNLMQQCTCEWDNIFKGFELLAFSLLEMRPPSLPGRTGSSTNTINPISMTSSHSMSGSVASVVLQLCWNIGSNILLQMIKKFPDSASSIVQKLVERLQDVGNDAQYISTLSLMVQQNPVCMLECKNSLNNLLYNMDYRGVSSAKKLYAGIAPLFRSSGALRDSAFLVLRKLLHSCSEDARQVAVVGFLQIMKHFRFYVPSGATSSLSQISFSSQANVDVHYSQSSNGNRAFCTELIKLLHCALSQQSVVRLTLYQSLPEVVSRNPELLPEIVKMLRSHLKFFIDPEGVVQTDLCVQKDGSSSQVIEPLGHLIQSIHQVILRSGMVNRLLNENIDGNSEDQIDLGVLALCKLSNSLAQASTDDFNFGDPQESCDAHLKIQTLAAVCVALADFCITHNATTRKAGAKQLVRIYEIYIHFEKLIGDQGKNKAKGKGKILKGKGKKDGSFDETSKEDGIKTPKGKPYEPCIMSLQSIARFTEFMEENNSSSTDAEILAIFKTPTNIGLHHWIVQSGCAKYHMLRLYGDVEGLSPESLIKFSGSIARVLLNNCMKARRVTDEHSCALYSSSLNCIHEILMSIVKHHPMKLSRLLMAMDETEKSSMPPPLESLTTKALQKFKELLNYLLSGRESEDLVAKSVVPIIGIITVLSDQLNPSGVQYTELYEWVVKLCKDVECSEPSTVKSLIGLLIHLCLSCESSPSVLSELAKEFRLATGTLGEEDSSNVQQNKFATINGDTVSTVLCVITSGIENLLVTIEWAICRIGVIERGDSSPAVERSVHDRLRLIVLTLSELVQADIRPGPNSELVLKSATSLYTTMKGVANRQGKTILPSFQRLVKLIATHFTTNVYTFISHIDNEEKDNEKGMKRKRGEKDVNVAKLGKSARFIPALIFALEQYSQAILKVSKRTKEDLSLGFKPGTTRDFRIKIDKVNQVLEGEEEEEENASDTSNQEQNREQSDNPDNENRNGTINSQSRARGTARRSRGRGRGKYLSMGAKLASRN